MEVVATSMNHIIRMDMNAVIIEERLCEQLVPQLWIVRKSLVQKCSRRWNIGNAYIFDITESSIQEAKNRLNEIIFNSVPLQ